MQLSQTLIGAATHGLAALTYLILTALLAATWQRSRHGAALIAATLLTAAWAGAEAFGLRPEIGQTLLLLRSGAWALFLLVVLREVTHGDAKGFWRNPVAAVAAGVVLVGVLDAWVPLPLNRFVQVPLVAGLALAVLGLLLIENLFSFTRDSARWTFKHLLIGLGGLFAFDLFLYSGALLLARTDPMTLTARPLVQVLAVPFLLVSAARIRTLSFDVTISRETVLHTTALVGSGDLSAGCRRDRLSAAGNQHDAGAAGADAVLHRRGHGAGGAAAVGRVARPRPDADRAQLLHLHL